MQTWSWEPSGDGYPIEQKWPAVGGFAELTVRDSTDFRFDPE